MSEYRMLLVTDGDFIRTGVGKELEAQGYGVTAVDSGKKALKLLKKETFDLVIIDFIRDETVSFKVVKDIKEVSPETPAMILTANRDADSVIEAFRFGLDDCLLKPFEKEDLFLRIKRCLEKRGLQRKSNDTEELLKQSEERLRIMFEFAPDAYYISDKKGIFLDGNKAAEDMVGYKKEELIGKSFLKLNFLPLNQIPKAAALLLQSALRKSTGPDEFTLIRKDGSRVIVEIRTYPVMLEDKVMVLGIARDITKRKQAEEALELRTNFLDAIIESSALSMWISDEKGTAIRVNPACLELFGATEEEVIGKYNLFQDVVIEKQGFMPVIKGVFEKGEVANFVIDYDFGTVDHVDVANATHKIVQSIITPVLDGDGRISNAIVQSIDLTDIKKTEVALQKTTHILGERVKELNCMYGISKLAETEQTLEEILHGTVNLIPPSWQYPEITCAQVKLGGQSYKTDNFTKSEWLLSQAIIVNGEKVGAVEVYYLEEKPEIDEGPFLKEEKALINAIAERLGRIVERKQALLEIKTLHGIIPICSYCKQIRNDEGAWDIMEAYISEHTDAEFSHGICPDCYKKQMEELEK